MRTRCSAGTGFLVLAIVLQAEMGGRASEPVRTGLTIANRGTENPTILYNGKPMLRIGSVSEQAFFAFPWDSSRSVFKNVDQTHQQWTEWQRRNGMGYARAYPESGYVWAEEGPESEKIYPWKVVRWEVYANRDEPGGMLLVLLLWAYTVLRGLDHSFGSRPPIRSKTIGDQSHITCCFTSTYQSDCKSACCRLC